MKKRKRRLKKNFVIIILIVFIMIFIISSINIIEWIMDNKKINNTVNQIYEETSVKEIPDNENTEIIKQEDITEDNPYWKYIKMNLIDVDFDTLKTINPKTSGWIQVNGTNVNYPFVQGDNNSFYLSHSFDNSYNKAGWVFMDYRNNKYDFDKNTILYAHGRMDKSMFGSLRTILTSGWLNNENNYVIKLSTESENTLWQIFSVYRIPTTNDYIQVSFNSNEQFLEFEKLIKERSVFNFNTNLTENDKILTLSTCYNNSDKVVLHAKLIKREKK